MVSQVIDSPGLKWAELGPPAILTLAQMRDTSCPCSVAVVPRLTLVPIPECPASVHFGHLCLALYRVRLSTGWLLASP